MIITKQFLQEQARSRDIRIEKKQLIVNENISKYSENIGYDIFISHSFLDKELVLTLVDLFNRNDFSVYVDWLTDKELSRDSVNEKTAKLIRDRISSSRCLAYVSTTNISSSKWCPWELGIADGALNGKATILPVMDKGEKFSGQEYLSVYPYLDYAPSNSGDMTFWVNDPQDPNKYTTLKNWISGQSLSDH